jgi:hypothetical protein
MSELGIERMKAVANHKDRLFRLAGWCAYASGVACIFGIVFLVLFFGGAGGMFGTLNDIAVIVQYVLALPIVFAIQRLQRPQGTKLNRIATLIGLTGMLIVILLQTLLVTDVLPFSQQVGPVIGGFMVILAWFVLSAHIGRDNEDVPSNMTLAVFSGLYIAYPFWAFSLGRRLLS